MCGYDTHICGNFVNVLFEGSREIEREGTLNMSYYVSERTMMSWHGMITLFHTERYKMPIEGSMKEYEYFLHT